VAHFGRHQLAVAGEDFHGNTARLQRFQRRGGGLFRRIEEGDVALEDQIGFVDTLIVPSRAGRNLLATATTRSP
jgi:MOSC domain-containing protein YiiM